MLKVICPNCRNEQDVEKFKRCIICGQILFKENKVKAKVIQKKVACSPEEIEKKFKCEFCGNEAETLIDETHLICKKCKWKRSNPKK